MPFKTSIVGAAIMVLVVVAFSGQIEAQTIDELGEDGEASALLNEADIVLPAPPPAPRQLRLAVWDASGFALLSDPPGGRETQARWRTTFGAERATAPPPPAIPESAASAARAADIVVIQGVANLPLLRRTFPAREWRFVVSRRGFAGDGVRALQPGSLTVMVVRAQRGVRARAAHFFLSQGPASDTESRPMALKVQAGLASFWVVSLSPCRLSAEACETARQRLADWRSGLAKEPLVLAGPLAFPAPEARRGDCGHLGIEATEGLTRKELAELPQPNGAGCIVATDVSF